MANLSYNTLFLVVAVNIAFILTSCVLATKHSARKETMAKVLLVDNLFMDVGCCVLFWVSGISENSKVFLLFIPLTLMLLIPAEKEKKKP